MHRPPHAAAGFRPDIQGLRAVAVLAVVIYHAGVSLVPGGYSGVDVFFVISGFLITSHLLSTLRDHGTIRLSDFYARRIRRILPAALTVLVLTALASVLLVPRVDVPGTLEDAAATALYMPNLLFAAQGTDYLAETSPSPFQHYWSLGIEEQFYLLWPAVLLGTFFLVRRSNRRLAAVIAALVAASFASGLVLLEVSPPWAFFSLPSRAWELGVGALAALALRHAAGRLSTAVGRVLIWSGLAGMLTGFVLLTSTTPFPGVAALLPTLSTAAVILGGSAAPHPALLTNRPMQAMGKWSYSLYLVHWPLLTIPQLAVGVEHPLPLAGTLALGALSVPLAILLHRYVEGPFRRGPARGNIRRTGPTLAMATAGSLVIAGSAYGAGLYIDRTPATAAQPAERKAGLPYPEGTPFVPSNVTPVLERAATSAPPTNGDGCHAPVKQTEPQAHCIYGNREATQDVVLFGDSHAEQWFAGVDRLARDNAMRLRTLTKASCPAVSISIERQGAPYTECDQWREGALQTIREVKPRLVVLGNYGRVTPVDDSKDLRKQWEEGLRATIDALPEGTEVVVMADTPFHDSAPASCLSRNIDDAAACDAEPEEALNASRAAVERRVAEETGARFLDMNKYLCAEHCPAIIGDILAYRDAHHLSEPMGEALAPRLAAELDKEL
ncbi:peptidoglycan/LPS O-acetylase OafA/YrhL [Arthrobacter pigmenti]|uniref:Peptidoglycan/LPS O-acetylase OafA/YrhL n=1 Tax=Arthrobacter pigmenti TaxID=271432 RepID=A0A846RQT0_9MICC|nr:acyltransferase family protein [Arthrobacter pigmenti]NJC22527.1 peptidoglycan/LPS O-acetylase OafA/YrhL [Arthrobacter pigmenti]